MNQPVVIGHSFSKSHPCEFIKIRKMRGEVGKKTSKKEMHNIIPYFYDVTWLIFETHCPVTTIQNLIKVPKVVEPTNKKTLL